MRSDKANRCELGKFTCRNCGDTRGAATFLTRRQALRKNYTTLNGLVQTPTQPHQRSGTQLVGTHRTQRQIKVVVRYGRPKPAFVRPCCPICPSDHKRVLAIPSRFPAHAAKTRDFVAPHKRFCPLGILGKSAGGSGCG